MKYEVSINIDAKPETIWEVLTNANGYVSWSSGIIDFVGRISPGEKIKITSEVNPKRPFAAKVTEMNKDKDMTWQGGMPFGLLKGIRNFRLTPQDDGSTKFDMVEEFSGPMLGIVSKSMPDLQPSLDKFAKGLKKAAEAASKKL